MITLIAVGFLSEEKTSGARITRTQEQRSHESSRALIQAAVELIGEQGFARTTVAEIAERAGLSRPMVRERFGSKQGLLETLLRDEYDAQLFPATDPESMPTGRDRLVAPIERLLDLTEQTPELMRAFLVLSFETVGPAHELQAWMKSLLGRFLSSAEQAIVDGIADGTVHADVAPHEAAERLTAEGVGHAFLSLVCGDRADFATRMRSWRAAIERDLK